jgi:hypothetical protein
MHQSALPFSGHCNDSTVLMQVREGERRSVWLDFCFVCIDVREQCRWEIIERTELCFTWRSRNSKSSSRAKRVSVTKPCVLSCLDEKLSLYWKKIVRYPMMLIAFRCQRESFSCNFAFSMIHRHFLTKQTGDMLIADGSRDSDSENLFVYQAPCTSSIHLLIHEAIHLNKHLKRLFTAAWS